MDINPDTMIVYSFTCFSIQINNACTVTSTPRIRVGCPTLRTCVPTTSIRIAPLISRKSIYAEWSISAILRPIGAACTIITFSKSGDKVSTVSTDRDPITSLIYDKHRSTTVSSAVSWRYDNKYYRQTVRIDGDCRAIPSVCVAIPCLWVNRLGARHEWINASEPALSGRVVSRLRIVQAGLIVSFI